jgi:uncharacterized membrane protein
MSSIYEHPEHDLIQTQFDRLIALVGYALLFVGVFMAGVPSVVAVALALAHHNDTHPIIRTHYRHQVRIFLIAVVTLVAAILCGIVAGGLWIADIVGFIERMLGHSVDFMGMTPTAKKAWIGGLFFITAIVLFVFGALWTLASSAFGFMQLITNRPVGRLPKA